MKFYKIVLGVLLFTALLPSSIGIAQEEGQQYIVVADAGISMTASADEKGMVVSKLTKGTRVSFVRQQDNWVKVDYKGRLGWLPSDTIAPFTKELLPVYASYYKQLAKMDHVIYALIADFTQDGIEELYVVRDTDPIKGQYEEYIYSGDQLIYQKNNTNALTILKSGENYYLYHHAQMNKEKKFKLNQLNNQAKTDYFEVSEGKTDHEITTNSYLKSYYILSAGDSHVKEQTFSYEQIASMDYYGAEKKNDYEESIYLEKYAVSKEGKTTILTQQEYTAQLAIFDKSKVVKVIYDDHYKAASLNERFTYDNERSKKELIEMAAKIMPEKQLNLEAQELDALQQMLAQSVHLELPYSGNVARNMLSYFQAVQRGLESGMPGTDSIQLNTTKNAQDVTYDRAAIDQLIYNFYGVQMKPDEFNRSGNDLGYLMTNEEYTAYIMEETKKNANLYRQMLAVETIDSGYVAIHYQDYEMPENLTISEANESLIIAGETLEKGYVLLKRLPFKEGVRFVYIDTVDALTYLNTNQFSVYENSLDVLQKLSVEQKTNAVADTELEEIVESTNLTVANAQEPTNDESPTFSWLGWIGAGALVTTVFAAAFYVYRKKYLK
ncbi:MAG: SH3 domain-containing protein [Solibacillus sp.]|uniref:SH3 domain-containing protein n=1 Tax=Solibacillus sp. TaxID=1909654 RepID=UPI003314FBE1